MGDEKPAEPAAEDEDWSSLTDAEVVQEVGGHPSGDDAGQAEMTRRLVVALNESRRQAEEAAESLARLTWVLVVLTAVLVALTVFAGLRS